MMQDLTQEMQHVQSQHQDLSTPWLESILPKSESRLKTQRYGVAIDVIDHLDWVDQFGGVMDLVLLAFHPQLSRYAEAFYWESGPPLRSLLTSHHLAALDKNLDKAICRLTYLYETARRQARQQNLDEGRLLDFVVSKVGIKAPRPVNAELIRRTGSAAPAAHVSQGHIPSISNAATPAKFVVSLTKETVYDTGLGVTWQRSRAPSAMTFPEARAYASNLRLAHSRWRLPRSEEFEALRIAHESGELQQVFAERWFGWFWTATAWEHDLDFAWATSFELGETRTCLIGTRFNVRCVRDES
jgi:hypothetical protein